MRVLSMIEAAFSVMVLVCWAPCAITSDLVQVLLEAMTPLRGRLSDYVSLFFGHLTIISIAAAFFFWEGAAAAAAPAVSSVISEICHPSSPAFLSLSLSLNPTMCNAMYNLALSLVACTLSILTLFAALGRILTLGLVSCPWAIGVCSALSIFLIICSADDGEDAP